MTTLVLENEPAMVKIVMKKDKFEVALDDGRSLLIPIAWYPRLLHATAKERRNWRLLGNGYAIEWPDLDEHIGVEGLLAGRRSGESRKSFERWVASRK